MSGPVRGAGEPLERYLLIMRIMKKILVLVVAMMLVNPVALLASDREILLNAFGETATAYLNDSFLLLGMTADGYVADLIPKEKAQEFAKGVQKRVRIVRAKLKAVAGSPLANVDKNLIELLDKAYGCMDHQAWALNEFIANKNPDTAKRFGEQRSECMKRLNKIADFYSKLPPAPELPEPLSTR
jgi:hypothetical protein